MHHEGKNDDQITPIPLVMAYLWSQVPVLQANDKQHPNVTYHSRG